MRFQWGRRTIRPGRPVAAVVVLAGISGLIGWLCAPSVLHADDQSVQDKKKIDAIIEEAAEKLIADSALLEQYKLESGGPHLSRPHPAISTWGPQMVEPMLQRMRKSFTKNEYRDTYIRWHMMEVVKRVPQGELGEAAQVLVELVDKMPPPLSVEARPEWYDKPAEIGSRHRSLVASAGVAVGIPPFEKYFSPPDSYQYMNEQQKADAEAAYAEALALEGQFETIHDDDAKAFNKRVGFVNWVVRQYRGELIYALMWTGDRQVGLKIMAAIDRHARSGSRLALDLLQFLYQAAYEGALELYDRETRNDMSKRLLRTAKATEGWVSYGNQSRNFGDFSFHMIYLLKDEASITVDQLEDDLEGDGGEDGVADEEGGQAASSEDTAAPDETEASKDP